MQGGHSPIKLQGEQLITLMEIIESHNDATLEELCELLKEKTKVTVSRSTMGRVTLKLNYTVKKTLHTAEKESDLVQKKRVEFWQKIRDIPVENLVFLDESGVNLAMLRIYARALKGHRARGTKPQKRGKNVSLLTALSLDKVIASINIYGAVNGVAFEAFIANKLVPNLWTGACVVMDNAKIHLGK